MPKYLVAIHRPDGYDPDAAEDEAMGREIDALDDAMVAAGVRVFVGGLRPPGDAKSVRPRAGGGALVTAGPYLRAGEHVGGFWVLDVADTDAAVEWGRKAAAACRAPVEVRPFH
jgi:hypothetical protein